MWFTMAKYTKDEAIDILAQCRLLREAVDALEVIAYRTLADEETDNVVVLPLRPPSGGGIE